MSRTPVNLIIINNYDKPFTCLMIDRVGSNQFCNTLKVMSKVTKLRQNPIHYPLFVMIDKPKTEIISFDEIKTFADEVQ